MSDARPEAVPDALPSAVPHTVPPEDNGVPEEGAAAHQEYEKHREHREHRHDVDLMRLICSCAVMLGHVSATFVAAVGRQEANGPGAYWVGHLGDSANEFAVPMYFAMAGWAVLVGAPPRDSGQVWQRIARNGLPLFLWTGVYLCWAWLRGRNEDPLTGLAVDSLFGSVRPAYHLWFMYVYLPLIAVLAFAVLVRAGKRPWGLGAALLAVATVPTALTTVEGPTGWDAPGVGWGFGTYSVVYAVGGALLFALPGGVPYGRRRLLVPVLLAAFGGCVWYNTQVAYVIPNAHLFVATMTVCVLLLVSRVRIPQRAREPLTRLAGAALGAYMVHVFFVEELVRPLVSAQLGAVAAGLLLVGLWLATIALSYAASLLWGRLGLRRLLG
jgi:surface polysaccharide O-acyltransferase-like enzyme